MNKLFTKIVGAALGLTMAIGVGVTVSSNSEAVPVHAADITGDWSWSGTDAPSGFKTGSSQSNTIQGLAFTTTVTYSASGWALSSNNGKTTASFTTTGYTDHVDSIEIDWGTNSKKYVTWNAKVGDSTVQSEKVGNGSGTGSGTVTFDNWSDDSGTIEIYTTSPSGGYKITGLRINAKAATPCTVTLNKNGGSGGTDSVSATKGSAMPTLASAPTRTGYTFAGYYDDASAGTQYYTANRASARSWDKDGTTATLYAHWTANKYDISYYDQGGGTFSGSHESGYPTKHTYGTATTLKSATKGGYNFDGWFTTSACTGSAVTSLGATAYTAAINLYAKWTATGTTYSISTTVTNGTYSGDTSITDNGGVASVTISPTGDYKLPTSVSVSGASHTYNAETGVISLSGATGNVTISAAMVALTEYSITVNETNGSHTGASTIKESRTASLTFEPDSGYGQPASVAVTGATYTWTRGTGVLSLSNPTGNVTVTYAAAGNELDSISISTNSGSYTLGDNFVMPTVTAKYTLNPDADVTSSASYSGYNPYTTGNQNVTISYTEGGITKTQSYTANVSAKSVGHSYNKISSVSDIDEGDYILAYSTYAFDGRDANNGYTTVTITSDSISGTAAMDKLALHITPVTGGYTLRVSSTSDNNASKYLGFTSGSNSLSFNDNAVTIASQTVSSSTHYTYESGGAFTFGDSSTVLSWNNNSSNLRYRFYKTGTTSDATNGKNYYAFDLYKKVESGSASLIRITASYNGGDKYVGDSISTSDFTVQKQLDTGTALSPVSSGYTISANTLTAESNSITVSYTEGNITKTAVVVVPATPRSATVTSVTLVQGAGVVKDYIDYSAAAWDYTGLTVHCVWSDSTFNEDLSVADLIQSGDATVSPAKPTVGVTSFTISYEYHEVPMTSNSVTGINVVADYVTGISWTGTTGSHFKAFSGSQLTAAQVGAWSVVPTFSGAGQQSALSFGSYTLKVGNKTISSLPYTWASEDDGQKLTITYGKDENGKDFVKENVTAVANICATINAIDHDETTTGEQTLSNFIDTSSATWTVTEEGVSGGKDDGSSPLDVSNAGFRMESDNGYWNGTQLRSYKNSTFTISSSYTIESITFTFSGSYNGGLETSYTSINATSKTFADLGSQARITGIAIVYEGSVTTTVHYANDMNHFDAQKKVVEFAKFMNTTMNGTNVCSGTFANLESAWDDVADKYDELFGASTTLNETELAWALNMLKYATAAWDSEAEAACVEKAMKTYEHCVSHYDNLEKFMSSIKSVQSVKVSPLVNIIGENTNTVAIIVIISMVSVTAIGGYFFLRKRKENI